MAEQTGSDLPGRCARRHQTAAARPFGRCRPPAGRRGAPARRTRRLAGNMDAAQRQCGWPSDRTVDRVQAARRRKERLRKSRRQGWQGGGSMLPDGLKLPCILRPPGLQSQTAPGSQRRRSRGRCPAVVPPCRARTNSVAVSGSAKPATEREGQCPSLLVRALFPQRTRLQARGARQGARRGTPPARHCGPFHGKHSDRAIQLVNF